MCGRGIAKLFVLVLVAASAATAAQARYAVPGAEHGNAVLWLDLPSERRQRLTLGAIDALEAEGAPMVRSLAAQMLARIGIVEPARFLALPETHARPTAQTLARLVQETRGSARAGPIALAAYTTFWLAEPERYPWIEPSREEAAGIAEDIAAAIREAVPPLDGRREQIRKIARAQIDLGRWFSDKLVGVELLEAIGLTEADADALVDVLTSRPPEHSELERLTALILDLPIAADARRRLRLWLDAASTVSDASLAPLFDLAAAVGLRIEEVPFVAGRLDSRVESVRLAAARALAGLEIGDEDRAALRESAYRKLESRDWSEQGEAIRTLEWLGPTAEDLARLTDFLWRDAHALNVTPAWRLVLQAGLTEETRAEITAWARETLTGADFKLWFVEGVDTRGWRRAVEAVRQLGLVEGDIADKISEMLFVPAFGAGEHAQEALSGRLDADLEAKIRRRVTETLTETRRSWPAAQVLAWLGPRAMDLPILFETNFREDESGYGRSTVRNLLSGLEPGGALEAAYAEILRQALRADDSARRRLAAKELTRLGPSRAELDLILDELLAEGRPPDFNLVRQIAVGDFALGDEARARIGRALTSGDPVVRRLSLGLLQATGARAEDLPRVIDVLDDSNDSARQEARAALIARGTPSWPLPASVRLLGDEFIETLRLAQRDGDGGRDVWDWMNGAIIAFVSSSNRRRDAGGGAGAFLSVALRADGLTEPAFRKLLDQARGQAIRPVLRLVLRLLATAEQRALLRFLGAPAVLPPWDDGDARTLAATYHVLAQQAADEGLEDLQGEAYLRMAEAFNRGGGWRLSDLPDLRRYAETRSAVYGAAVERRIDALDRDQARIDWIEEGAIWAGSTLGGHALLWLALVFFYPTSRLVQAVFFWNPWVRRIFGLGYAFPLVLAIPPLRRRLVSPFSGALVADADLDGFDREGYFDEAMLRPLTSDGGVGEAVALTRAIPEIRGHIVLEGASGLGKTEALRALASRAPRPVAFLPAQRIARAGGPLEALARKMQGPAREAGFIRSLLHVNALDVAIDGLNEVGPEMRLKIVDFIEDLPRANIIVTTQPIAWSPPAAGATRRYELLPLDAAQIEDFLLARRRHLAEVALTEAAYADACHDFIARAIGPDVTQVERRRALVTLSNPMDLTLSAELIAAGARPTPSRLVEQQLEQLEAWFTTTYGRPFPGPEVAAHAFSQRQGDDNRIDLGREVVDALLRFRLAVPAPAADSTRGEADAIEARFRHDRVAEVFIARHLAAGGDDEALQSVVGDPRFQGVLIELASILPQQEARALFDVISDSAMQSGDHLLALAFARRMSARPEPAV